MATAVKCDKCGRMVGLHDSAGWVRLAVRDPELPRDDEEPQLVDLCSLACVGDYLQPTPVQ